MGATDTKKSLTVRQSKDAELFTNELTDNQAIRLLKEAVKARRQAQYPNLPEHAITIPKYDDSTANSLTRCIIDFINLQDSCFAWRVSTEGSMRDTRKTITDVTGNKRIIGECKRIKTTGQVGASDIASCCRGRCVMIEVKIKDKQSEEQKEWQKKIEASHGRYLIIKSFQEFHDWFNLKMERKHGS